MFSNNTNKRDLKMNHNKISPQLKLAFIKSKLLYGVYIEQELNILESLENYKHYKNLAK